MKRMVLKVLSVIMALCVFLGTMPIVVFAEDDGGFVFCTENAAKIDFSPNADYENLFDTNVNKFYNTGTQTDAKNFFYNQLTNNQKEIYEQLSEANNNSYDGYTEQVLSNGSVSYLTIPIELDLTNITISGIETSTQTAVNAAIQNALQDVMLAMSALYEDDPMFFGLQGYASLSYNGNSANSNGTETYTLTYLLVYFTIDTEHYSGIADIKTKQTAVKEKIATIQVNGISRHEKVKSIHDYIANNAEYDTSISKSNIFDAYGALVTGLCVCEGYAEAFKLLCNREGIPCITVVGTGGGGAHKWNMVQMENGEWYTLDATWDDQTQIYYSYFLIGSDTKTQYFGYSDVSDSTVHIGTGKIFTSANVALVYPTLSKDTYGIGNLRYGAKDIQFDATRNVLMLGKDISSYLNYIEYSGIFSRTANKSGTTGAVLTVSDTVTTKTYTVVKRGDADASNMVTEDDYNKILEISSAKATVTEGSAEYYAADLNQDGAIDTFDAMMLDFYMDGEYSFN